MPAKRFLLAEFDKNPLMDVEVFVDHRDGRVTLTFVQEVKEIEFTPTFAIELAKVLIMHAGQCGPDAG